MSYSNVFHKKIIKHDEQSTVIPVIDTHVHGVDFLQQTEGFKNLIEKMKNSNIEKSVVFGLSVKKKWEYFEPKKPHYYFSIYNNLLKSDYLSMQEIDKIARLNAEKLFFYK